MKSILTLANTPGASQDLYNLLKQYTQDYSDIHALDPSLLSWAEELQRFESIGINDIQTYFNSKIASLFEKLKSVWGDKATAALQNTSDANAWNTAAATNAPGTATSGSPSNTGMTINNEKASKL